MYIHFAEPIPKGRTRQIMPTPDTCMEVQMCERARHRPRALGGEGRKLERVRQTHRTHDVLSRASCVSPCVLLFSSSLTTAHLILCPHIGALRQQRSNHLHVAPLRSNVQRRPSVLPHKRASPSAPPSAILPTPFRLPAHTHIASVAVKARHCVPRFTRLLSAPQPTCPPAPPPPHAVAAPATHSA